MRFYHPVQENGLYLCPVCGYDQLDFDPSKEQYEICPSCGVEFGYADPCGYKTYLRAEWVRGGLAWWSKGDVQPPDWSGYIQLANLLVRE